MDPPAASTPTPPPVTVDPSIKIDPKHQKDIERDIALGKEYSKQIAQDPTFHVSKNPEYLARVEKIGYRLAAIANVTQAKALWGDKRLSPFEYHFTVLEDKDVNAFSLPGGFIYVNEGLMKYVESDDELAGVLAHEIAHAAFRHVATLQRESSKMSMATLPLILIAIFTGGANNSAIAVLQGQQLLTQAIGSGWSVKAEQAADYGGFQYMLKSPYNPTGMLTMMERLARDEKGLGSIDLGIYRTHPPGPERAASLTKDLQLAGIPIHRSEVTFSFRAAAKPGPDGSIELDFGVRKLAVLRGPNAASRAADAAKRLNTFFDQVPQLYEVRAGNDGSVVGLGQVMLTMTPADAPAGSKDSPAVLASNATKSIKDCLYSLAYRVWGVRS